MFLNGMSSYTMKNARAMLSGFLEHRVDNPLISPLIPRIFAAMLNLRPPKPKPVITWDPMVILPLLDSWGDNDQLSLAKLAAKLAFLIAVSSGCRVREMASLHLDHIDVQPSGSWVFRFLYLAKSYRTTRMDEQLQQIEVFPNAYNSNMCPLQTFRVYRRKTQYLRTTRFLFCSSQFPFEKITTQRLSKWFKEILAQAGVLPTKGTRIQSVRSMVSSHLFDAGVPLDRILAGCHWASGETFFRHYYKRAPTLPIAEHRRNVQKLKHIKRTRPGKRPLHSHNLLNVIYGAEETQTTTQEIPDDPASPPPQQVQVADSTEPVFADPTTQILDLDVDPDDEALQSTERNTETVIEQDISAQETLGNDPPPLPFSSMSSPSYALYEIENRRKPRYVPHRKMLSVFYSTLEARRSDARDFILHYADIMYPPFFDPNKAFKVIKPIETYQVVPDLSLDMLCEFNFAVCYSPQVEQHEYVSPPVYDLQSNFLLDHTYAVSQTTFNQVKLGLPVVMRPFIPQTFKAEPSRFKTVQTGQTTSSLLLSNIPFCLVLLLLAAHKDYPLLIAIPTGTNHCYVSLRPKRSKLHEELVDRYNKFHSL